MPGNERHPRHPQNVVRQWPDAGSLGADVLCRPYHPQIAAPPPINLPPDGRSRSRDSLLFPSGASHFSFTTQGVEPCPKKVVSPPQIACDRKVAGLKRRLLRDEVKKQLRADGVARTVAIDRAWEAMLDKYPPVPQEEPANVMTDHRTADRPIPVPNLIEDVFWVTAPDEAHGGTEGRSRSRGLGHAALGDKESELVLPADATEGDGRSIQGVDRGGPDADGEFSDAAFEESCG